MNKPECTEVAYVNEDKFLVCPYPNGTDSSRIERDVTCEGFPNTSSTVLSLDVVEWSVANFGRLNVLNANGTAAVNKLLRVLPSGTLYITRVQKTIDSVDQNAANCTVMNSEGVPCWKARLTLILHGVGEGEGEGGVNI